MATFASEWRKATAEEDSECSMIGSDHRGVCRGTLWVHRYDTPESCADGGGTHNDGRGTAYAYCGRHAREHSATYHHAGMLAPETASVIAGLTALERQLRSIDHRVAANPYAAADVLRDARVLLGQRSADRN